MYLFSYGTFQEKYIQEGLFGEQIPMINGVLEDYILRLGEDGYYNLETALKNCVEGKLLILDDVQILCADQWEEVPVYERKIKQIATEDGMVEAWVYFKTKEQVNFCVEKMQDNAMTSAFESDELRVVFNTFLEHRTMREGFADVYCVARLLEDDLQNRKQMPNELSELMIFSLPHEGYEIKHIAFTIQVTPEHTYAIIGVPISIRQPRAIMEGICTNKAFIEAILSVVLADTLKMIVFESQESTIAETQMDRAKICFNKTFSERFEREKKVIKIWLEALSR